MKIRYAAVSCLLVGCLVAQTMTSSHVAAEPKASSSSGSLETPKVDPAKEADIRKLMTLVGTTELVTQIMGSMEKSIKPLMTGSLPPGEYRTQLVDLFFAKFNPKLTQSSSWTSPSRSMIGTTPTTKSKV